MQTYDVVGVSGGTKLRHLAIAAVIALCGAAAALGLASSARADAYYVTVNLGPSSFQVQLNSTTLASGNTVPAGCYSFTVNNTYPTNAGNGSGGPAPAFAVSGPGGYLIQPNNLDSSGMGEDPITTFGFSPNTPYAFQPGSSYTIADQADSMSVSVTATGSGSVSCTSATGGGSTGSSGTGTVSSNPMTTTMPTTSTPPAPKVIGTIDATVSAAGRPSLKLDGHGVKTLKPGRYTVVVEDHSTHAGLIIGERSKTPLTLSGIAAVGRVKHSVTFRKGSWYVEGTTHGPKMSFVVS